MKKHTFHGYTLGCRLNAYETEAIMEELRQRCSFEQASGPENADIIIVNTCAVTGRSQARSRKAVRSLRKRNSNALIAVTGCVAEVSPDDFQAERVMVVPNTAKAGLVDIICSEMGLKPLKREHREGSLFPEMAPRSTARTRAFLKVQDGCDNRCTYCIVPLARGNSRSQPGEIVLEQAEMLAKSGFREIVLTGVDLIGYGRDLYGDSYDLTDLVADLVSIGGFRIRISSTEPVGLTDEILCSLSATGVCRHFHLPLQSGSDKILQAMGRRYGRRKIDDLLESIGKHFPGAAVGADLIVGFPGESEEDFRMTMDLASDPRIAYLHVFPFSPRPGTPAFDMKDKMIHPETVSERAFLLRSVSAESRKRFRTSQIGEEAQILVEGRMVKNRMIGLTDNYIPLLAPENSNEGELVRVTVSSDLICWELR